MNRKVVVVLSAILIAVAISSAYAYQTFYTIEQADVEIRDSNVTIYDSNITIIPSNPDNQTLPPEKTPQPYPEPKPKEPLPYDFVVYEWHLNQQQINNVTWLNVSMGYKYNTSISWVENYIYYLSRLWAKPTKSAPGIMRDYSVFVNAEFDQITGYTKATYLYKRFDGHIYYYFLDEFINWKFVDFTKTLV